MRKRVAFIANSLDNAYKFQQVLSKIGVDVVAGSTQQASEVLGKAPFLDLVVFEALGGSFSKLAEIAFFAERRNAALLAIVDETDLGRMDLPASVACDFAVNGASESECIARVTKLLGIASAPSRSELLAVEDMVINLDTYQVLVAGEPIDLTYLEYALLAFFVKHPDRAFSREALLEQVWGLDYFGGSRTVDVHVRRIRAKIGPGLSQHLETVRGVGYLWKSL